VVTAAAPRSDRRPVTDRRDTSRVISAVDAPQRSLFVLKAKY
jgi:hypothetical protein